jgi:hypothetical protein
MAEQQVVNLSCSFCGKNQREVKKLIAGPTVYICDECIGLCNDIIAEEIEREAGEAPKTVRLEIGRLLGDEASAADELRAYGDRSAAEVPDAVKRAISSLVAASEALRTSVQQGSLPPEKLAATPPVPAWLDPALARLTRTEDLSQGLRLALERSLAPERMIAFDRILGQLSALRETLLLNARNEEAGRLAERPGPLPVD